jgi:hypothetical protein
VYDAITDEEGSVFGYKPKRLLLDLNETFTRSNGTNLARLYERLTKASRRRAGKLNGRTARKEQAYREGLYDAYKALQEELNS